MRSSTIFTLIALLVITTSALAGSPGGPLEPIKKTDASNPRYNDVTAAAPAQPAERKPFSDFKSLPPGSSLPAAPQTYFCDLLDYTSGSAVYYWTIPDSYGDDLFNMRMTSEPNFDCSLKVAHYLMYWPQMTATDMRCYLWSDDGFGFPGSKLDSVDITWAEIDSVHTASASSFFFLSADFSAGNWVFSDGEEYHLGFTALDQVNGKLAIISDAGDGPYSGEQRASENWNGFWGTMLNDWGDDVSFFIYAERCCAEIPYSDCYTQSYAQNVTYFWRAPHPAYGDEAYSQSFTVDGPDTLVSVDVAVYDDASSSSAFDPAGNNDIYVTVYGDDGSGLPDPSNVIATQTLPAGTYPFFPSLATATFNHAFTYGGNFHIAFSTDGVQGSSYESLLSSDGNDGVGGSASDWGGGNWIDMLSGWGLDVNFLISANICIDPHPYCSWNSEYDTPTYFWRLPDAFGDIGQAQKINAVGGECRVQEVNWYLYDNGTPTAYTTGARASIYSDLSGLPGSELASVDIGPGTSFPYTYYPAPMNIDFSAMNILVNNDYWIAIQSYGTDSTDGIRTMSDAGGSATDAWAEFSGSWGLVWQEWGGVGSDWNAVAEAFHCCQVTIPPSCFPFDNDWSTLQGNFARTGRSELSLGDSWCDLNLNWSYEDPTSGVAFCGPTVYGDKVICAFDDHVNVFSLTTGSLIYTISPGLPYMGTGVRNTPTVQHIAALGTDVIFLGGGDQQSVMAYDLNSGSQIWARSVLEVGTGGLFGATRWGTFVILDMGGQDVLYWGTDLGNIVAADAATGNLYSGWSINPVATGYSTFKTGATDGTQLFFGNYSPAGEGDIYAIDAATGDINWQLSSSGGLQAANVYGADYTAGDEGFLGLSFDPMSGVLFANSRCEGDYPTDGLFYTINAANGSLAGGGVTRSNRAYYASPIVDINRVYMPTLTRWSEPPASGNLVAFNKYNGSIQYATQSASGGRYYVDGLLTCENYGTPQQIFAFNEDGFLSCFQSEDGVERWRRRIFHASGYNPNIGMGGAIAADPATNDVHLLFSDFWGDLYDLTKGSNRPRLQFHTYNPTAPVEFGSATSMIVDAGPLLTNTGCSDLDINEVNVDANPFVPDVPSFSGSYLGASLMRRSSEIAGLLVSDDFDKLAARTNLRTLDEENLAVRPYEKETANPAAAGFPTFINAVVEPTVGQVLSPGDDAELILDVIQSAINRGPQVFYIEIGTNDPDFFLNDPTMKPQVMVTLVGGCLVDTTTLHFGVGSSNSQLVTNVGRLGTGDWSPHGFDIAGDASSYYQGSYGLAMSKYRVATNSQDWSSGGGEADALVSMQADPNYCDNQCKPALATNVSLGAFWNGTNYQPIFGNLVCASFLDSVQNTWDYGWGTPGSFGQPFDNDSTMGLYCNQRTVGAVDLPALADVTLAIFDITERNGNALNDVYLFSFHDYDVGSDNGAADINHSIAWSYNPGGDAAWGQIKIPFGPCDGPGLINAHGLQGAMALWDWGAYWDSAYTFMTAGNGYFDHDMGGGDGELHITLDRHSYAGSDSHEIGVANFGLSGLADNSGSGELGPLATLINQWSGFGRGDVNNDGVIGNLADIIYLAAFVNSGGGGPVPFMHLGDVNCDGGVDNADINYLVDYYFSCGPCPCGEFVF